MWYYHPPTEMVRMKSVKKHQVPARNVLLLVSPTGPFGEPGGTSG